MKRVLVGLLFTASLFAQAPQMQALLGASPTSAGTPYTLVTGAHGCVDNAGAPFNDAVSTPFDASGVTLMIVAPTRYSVVAASETISDSSGNTYTALTLQDSAASTARIYYKLNPAVTGTFTITDSTAAGFPSFCFVGFAGGTPAYASIQNGAVINNDPSPTTLSTGAVAPDTDNQVIVAFIAHASTSGNTTTINSSFTPLDQNPASSCCYQTFLAYQLQTTATTRNPQFDLVIAPSYAAAVIATFK